MNRKVFLALMFVFPVLLGVVGCGESDNNSDKNTEVVTNTTTQPVNGNSLKIMVITSDQGYSGDKQAEVKPKFEAMINGGQYNVVSVKTSYSSGFLVAAEVNYDSSGVGQGNRVRVLLLESEKTYVGDKQNEVRPKLEETVNSGKFNIVKTQSVYRSGCLVAAEVYYFDK